VLVLVEFERRDDRERNRRSSILAKALTEVDGFCSFLLEACVEVGGGGGFVCRDGLTYPFGRTCCTRG
jgi:hypothetical protein